jgi:hypothetical protein
LQQAVVVSENHAYPLAQLGHALGQSGRKHEAERILEQLMELCQGSYVPPCWLAMVCAGLGADKAIAKGKERLPLLRHAPLGCSFLKFVRLEFPAYCVTRVDLSEKPPLLWQLI